jgi:hypothetical protein
MNLRMTKLRLLLTSKFFSLLRTTLCRELDVRNMCAHLENAHRDRC